MSIIACPRCRDEVTLPPKVSPQARVRCPLCRDEYILSEALAAMPPALIVLDPGPGVETGGYAEPEYRVAGDAGVATAPGGVFDTTGPAGEEGVSTAPRPLKGGKPRKRKEGSAIGMMVQVVFGGVAAIVIFQALAWWVMDKDPFELGPSVAKYVPAIVPKRWHGKSNGTNEKPASNGNNAVASLPNTNNQKPKTNGASNTFDPGPQFNNVDPAATNPLDVVPPKVPAPGEIAIDDPLNPAPKPKPEKPMPEKPVDFTPPMPKPLDPNAKPQVSSAQIRIPHAMAVAKSAAFDEAEPTAKRQAGKEMFESAADLGKITVQADLADPELEDVVSQVKQYSILMSGKLLYVNFFALQRWNAKEGDDGMVIGGKIVDVKSAGEFFEASIEIPQMTGSVTVPVVMVKNPLDEGAKIGDTAVVLGRLVRDPKKDLPKYAGESAQVIHAGQATFVPQN